MFETTIPCGVGTTSLDGVPIDDSMAEEQWTWLEKQLQEGQEYDIYHENHFDAQSGSKPNLVKHFFHDVGATL